VSSLSVHRRDDEGQIVVLLGPDAPGSHPLGERRRHLSTSNVILRGGTVKTVTLDVRAPAETIKDFVRVWKTGKAEKSARISFASPELLWKVLTAKRWALLKALCDAGPVSIREAARRVDRDVKAVHSDVTALLNAGVLDRVPGGGVVFPYDAVRVEFLLRAAS
jgi:predicted transcriptional regulator